MKWGFYVISCISSKAATEMYSDHRRWQCQWNGGAGCQRGVGVSLESWHHTEAKSPASIIPTNYQLLGIRITKERVRARRMCISRLIIRLQSSAEYASSSPSVNILLTILGWNWICCQGGTRKIKDNKLRISQCKTVTKTCPSTVPFFPNYYLRQTKTRLFVAETGYEMMPFQPWLKRNVSPACEKKNMPSIHYLFEY